MNNKERVMIIGIDGATFDIIQPMVERGELPAIASIMRSGVWGNLFSTIPSTTSPAWLSLFSGVNPGKLGTFYLTRDSHLTYDEGPPADFSKISVKLLWHCLSGYGKKVLCVLPFPFPPAKINGVMVSHFKLDMDSEKISFKSYPAETATELSRRYSGRFIERFKCLHKKSGRTPKKEFLDNLIKVSALTTEITREISLSILERHEWDLFITVFHMPDAIQHRFWSYMDPTHPLYNHKGKETYGNVIFDAYKQVDKAVGDIIQKIGDTTTIIVSDHGMSPVHKFFYTNRWLKEKGFLSIKGNRNKPSFSMTRIPLSRILERFHIRTGLIPDFHVPSVSRKPLPIPEEVDWNRTKAYATIFGMNINLEGREPCGAVKENEYDDVCEALRQEIYGIKDPETGEKVIENVYRRGEIYSGTCLDDAPDIVYLFKQPFYYVKKDIFSSEIFKEITSKEIVTANHLNHQSQGIFLAKGPHIVSQAYPDRVHINDITPTILYLMDQPIPKNVDGRILFEILQHGLCNERRPVYIEPEYLQGEPGGLSPEEEGKIKEQLRQLGYI